MPANNGTAKVVLWASGALLALLLGVYGLTATYVDGRMESVRADISRHECAIEAQRARDADISDRLARIETKLDALLCESD